MKFGVLFVGGCLLVDDLDFVELWELWLFYEDFNFYFYVSDDYWVGIDRMVELFVVEEWSSVLEVCCGGFVFYVFDLCWNLCCVDVFCGLGDEVVVLFYEGLVGGFMCFIVLLGDGKMLEMVYVIVMMFE